MSRLLIAIVVAVALVTGCDLSLRTPDGPTTDYPVRISDATERREIAEREWRRMLDAYNLPQAPPELHPLIYTPRSLSEVSGKLTLVSTQPEAPALDPIAIREVIKRFIARWRDLLGADPSLLSLESESRNGDETIRFNYLQANYPLPVRGDFGRLLIVVGTDGTLFQVDSTLIPVVDLPIRPSISREDAMARIAGKTFTYSDIAGEERRHTVPEDFITARSLVVLPVASSDSITVHLAWEILAGDDLSWTVFLDAITGEELIVRQNFST